MSGRRRGPAAPDKGIDKARAPCRDVVTPERLEHCRVPLAPLVERHVERMRDAVGHFVAVVGVDDDGAIEFTGGACQARQHQRARIVRILRGHVFLGHEVHAVAHRRDDADRRMAE